MCFNPEYKTKADYDPNTMMSLYSRHSYKAARVVQGAANAPTTNKKSGPARIESPKRQSWASNLKKTGTRVRSHVPPERKTGMREGTFAKTTLLRNHPFVSSRFSENCNSEKKAQ